MADVESIGSAYLNVIPKLSGDASSSIASQATDGLGELASAAGEGFGGKLLAGMKGPLIGAGAVLGGAMGIGKLAGDLMGIGQTFDDMTDTIVVGTGASGAALDALADSAKSIATTVPTTFQNAGDVVQNLNTRMGLVGEELENVGSRVVAAGQMLGQEVNLDSLTGAFNAFGVANEDAAAKMDYLFNVGQATGIGFNDLTSVIESNAPALQNLGFSFEESANMAGLLDKAGMDAGGTMSKMSKALVELAEPGQSAADAYRGVIEQMEGYIEAGDTAAAIDVASTVFGTRGAAQFVGAVQSGALSLDELSNAALGAGDGIMGTMEATMDWPERWELLKNKATEALEPIGGALMEGASRAMEKFSEAMEGADPQFFDDLAEGVAGFIEGGAQALVDGIQWAIDNKETIGEWFSGFAEGVRTAIDVLGTIADVIGTTVVVAGDVLGGVFALMTGDVDGAKDGIASAADVIGEKLGFPGVGDTVRGVFDGVEAFMKDPVGTAADAIGGFAKGVMDDLGFSGLVEDVTGIFDSIGAFMEDPIGNASRAIAGFVDDILGAFDFEWSLPELKLPHIVVGEYIEVPVLGTIPNPTTLSVEWYAKGGIFNAASVIGVGEAGAEAVLPIDRLVPLLADAMKKVFSGGDPGSMLSGVVAEWADGVSGAASGNLAGIPAAFGEAMDAARTAADAALDGLSGAFGAMGASFLSALSDMESGAARAVTAFSEAFSELKSGVAAAMEGASRELGWGLLAMQPVTTEGVMDNVVMPANDTLQGIVQAWAMALNDMTRVQLPSFDGFGWSNVPSVPGIPGYATGGIVDGSQLIRAGERGAELIWPSYEPYLTKYADAIASSMGGGGVKIEINNPVIRETADVDRLLDEANRKLARAGAATLR